MAVYAQAEGSASVLTAVAAHYDLLIVGEMSKEDVLSCVGAGANVVLCNYWGSPRHILHDVARALKELTGLQKIFVWEKDVGPLQLA